MDNSKGTLFKSLRYFCLILVIFLGALTIIASGGGGGDGDDGNSENEENTPEVTGNAISGLAAAGLISGGTVSVYAVDENGQKGDLLGSTVTASDGSYSVSVTDNDGPVLVEISGGTYIDEATGLTKTLDTTLRAALPSVTEDITVAITPLTEIAVRMAEAGGGLDVAKIEDANELVSQLLNADIISTLPADSSDSANFGSASADQQNYALLLAAMSQWSENSGNLADVIGEIEDDMADLKLDTAPQLLLYLEDFLAGEENNTGITDASGLLDIIDAIAEAGFEPTGDLAELKKLLVDFLNEPTDENYGVLMTYMNTFTPPSEEAYLFKAMATLMDIYQNDAAGFLTDNGFNLEVLDPDTIFNSEAFQETLLRLAALDTNITALLSEIESSLESVYSDLENAEGVKTSVSLTGFDTIYLDDVDIKILKTITRSMQSLFILAQAIDLGVDNWMVESGTIDLRDLIGDGMDLTEEQEQEFLNNNPDSFKYLEDTTKLASFRSAFEQLSSDLQSVVTALDALGSDGREMRIENAFNIDTDYGFYLIKAVSEKTMPSIIEAMDDPDASFASFENELVDASIVKKEDGYSYYQQLFDIYLVEMNPVEGGITLYDLLNGNKSFRDLIGVDPDEQYIEAESPWEIYMEDIEAIDWDDPIPSFTVPAAAVAIDGDGSDWTGVANFQSGDGFSYKLAAGEDNSFYAYMSFPDDFDFDENRVRSTIEISLPWFAEYYPFPEGEYGNAFGITVDKEHFIYDADGDGVYDEDDGDVLADLNGNDAYDGDEVVIGATEVIYGEDGLPYSRTTVSVSDTALIYDSERIAGIEVKFSHFDWLTADNYIDYFSLDWSPSQGPPGSGQTVIDQTVKFY